MISDDHSVIPCMYLFSFTLKKRKRLINSEDKLGDEKFVIEMGLTERVQSMNDCAVGQKIEKS